MSQQGNCPKCGGYLTYEGRSLATDDGHCEPVYCRKCGWRGYENYAETCTGHENLDPNEQARPAAPSYVVEAPPAETRGVAPDGTRCYRVVYEIDVMARDPRDAAEQTVEIFHDPGSQPFFTVIDSDGRQTQVDMMEDDDPGDELTPTPYESPAPPMLPA